MWRRVTFEEVDTYLHDALIDPCMGFRESGGGVLIAGLKEFGWLLWLSRSPFAVFIPGARFLGCEDPANIGRATLSDLAFDQEAGEWRFTWITDAVSRIQGGPELWLWLSGVEVFGRRRKRLTPAWPSPPSRQRVRHAEGVVSWTPTDLGELDQFLHSAIVGPRSVEHRADAVWVRGLGADIFKMQNARFPFVVIFPDASLRRLPHPDEAGTGEITSVALSGQLLRILWATGAVAEIDLTHRCAWTWQSSKPALERRWWRWRPAGEPAEKPSLPTGPCEG